jgi:hypothetical protein
MKCISDSATPKYYLGLILLCLLLVDWVEREFREQWKSLGNSRNSVNAIESMQVPVSKQWNQYLQNVQDFFRSA